MQPTVYADEPHLIAIRFGSIVLTFAHDVAHWHALDGWGPWWRVVVGRA